MTAIRGSTFRWGFGKLVPNPNVNWGYETEPEPGLGGRSIIWPRGKVLGGSGSINGLVFLRGAPSDYDEWQRLGAEGWGYRDVLPYFKRMEHCVDGANEWRGTGGPMTISNIKRPSTVAKAFVDACERLQYQRNPDFNGERIDGIGFAPLNVHNGWRRSTAVGYLKPNLNRRNLELMTKTHVRRILFEGHRAVGVEVERGGRIQHIGARRELILSGGSINSPVLLLASGIGPAGELAAQGIEVKLDLRRRRQEFAGSLSVELCVQNSLTRHAQRSRHVAGQVGKTRVAVANRRFRPDGGRCDRSNAVRQIEPVRAGAGYPVPGSQLLVGRSCEWLASLARLQLHLQRLPAEKPGRDHAAR